MAGSVGAMLALIMGVSDERALARATDLGVAMQLTNVARDVGEDAAAGRLYLPLDGFARAGLDPERWLAEPADAPAIAAMVRRLLARADRLYRRADAGVAALPPACRPGVRAARLVYAAIGDEIARAGHRSVARRAVVSRARQCALLARALATVPTGDRARRDAARPARPLAANLALVRAAARADPAHPRNALSTLTPASTRSNNLA